MKKTLKNIALFTLSVCILTGGAVSSFAAEPAAASAAVVGHQAGDCGDESSNAAIVARFTNADGSTSLYTICAEGGEVNGKDTLTEVKDADANFYGLSVYTGTLDNGQQILTAACITGGSAITGVTADLRLPKTLAEGCDFYLVNADGTETKLTVSGSSSSRYVVLPVDMADGAALIRMVPQTDR